MTQPSIEKVFIFVKQVELSYKFSFSLHISFIIYTYSSVGTQNIVCFYTIEFKVTYLLRNFGVLHLVWCQIWIIWRHFANYILLVG